MSGALEQQSSGSAVPSSRYPPVVRLLLTMGRVYSRWYHHARVLGECPLPADGPAILVCNHISGVDPVLVQSASPRLVAWMMAKEYYELRALKWFFKRIGAISVQRSGRDLTATRAALRALEQGRILGVFPEGKISLTDDVLPFQTGVALMAIKTGVPVYPAYLEGTQRGREMLGAFAVPCRAMLTFGGAVEFDRSGVSHEALGAATERIREAVMELRAKVRSAFR
jgi:1-acyl-sn-glycerol-3-phosphate acyltransferase